MTGAGAGDGPDAPPVVLHAVTAGFFRNRRLRRIIELAGYDLRFGVPGGRDGRVAVWGRTRYARRGLRVANWRNAAVVTIEDAFVRSVLTGRAGAPPQGLLIDKTGVYFDCSAPSDLENILNYEVLDTPGQTRKGQAALARFRRSGLSKYNNFDPQLTPDCQGYVLVIDQTRNDASIRLGGADAATFAAMLAAAKAENPGQRILVKTHPEVAIRQKRGHFTRAVEDDGRTRLIDAPMSPATLLAGADKVYCVTSLVGFEAILAGHRPHVFGRPFYGGWGLSEDRQHFQRRHRRLGRTALFVGAMMLYPTWYDVYRDRLCDLETLIDNLEAQARAHREDCHGYMAMGMRMWKRAPLRRFFRDAGAGLVFQPDLLNAADQGRRGLIWAGKETPPVREVFSARNRPLLRLEDGFLRSRGLGARLVPPLSLVVDDLGIYYDPARESRLERLLNASGDLPDDALARAARLRANLIAARLSKYNVGAPDTATGAWPTDRTRILVPGQVEDDASILRGAGAITTNLGLLRKVRAENPDAFVVFKPHPDVEAGLRAGAVAAGDIDGLADEVLSGIDAITAIDAVDEVWTMTSLLGFEALLRGRSIVCLGAPFYAGWGLSRDLGRTVERRRARPSLDALVHCALIDYPRYFDPKTGLSCPVEVVVERLKSAEDFSGGRVNRTLSRVQGLFASFAPFWR